MIRSLIDAIGSTPLLEVHPEGISAHILLKLEGFNPGGSAKDRVALAMINDARQKGLLPDGGTIIEPTSGNTGIGLAWIGKAMGYKVILTMPDTMSLERRKLLAAYGATVVLTPGAEGMTASIAKAKELQESIPGSFIPGQFDNPANPEAHFRTTGPEIWEQSGHSVDMLVAGVGTGGTLCGTAQYLRSVNPSIKVVAVEPAASPVISEGRSGMHKIQGIGANFIPANYDSSVVDKVLPVSDEAAYEGARALTAFGILAGISGGAAYSAALELARLPENAQERIAAIIPDSGERYLSTPELF